MDWHLLSQAAALTQQTYCFFQPHGQKVGDSTLLYEYGDGNVKQRAAIFKSDSLGMAVAFEGTEPLSILSILHDVESIQIPVPDVLEKALPLGSKVFFGFIDAYQAVARPVFDNLKRLMKEHNEERVTVIGYSLGGAMATLAAAEYQYLLPNGVRHVFTFGLPRVGNPTFATGIDKLLKGKFYYVVNGRDWVPHMPPRDGAFSHPSGQIWINPSGSSNWAFYPGQENKYGANSVKPIWTLDDHINYYFHTGLGPGVGKCPAKVGDQK